MDSFANSRLRSLYSVIRINLNYAPTQQITITFDDDDGIVHENDDEDDGCGVDDSDDDNDVKWWW